MVTGLGDRTIGYESIEDVRVVDRQLEIHERAPASRVSGWVVLATARERSADRAPRLARRIREG